MDILTKYIKRQLKLWGEITMVISDRKPMEEILGFLKDAKKIILVGCNQCAAASKTGGEPELEEMKALLEAEGKEVTRIPGGARRLQIKNQPPSEQNIHKREGNFI